MSENQLKHQDFSSKPSHEYIGAEKISDLFELYDRGYRLIEQKRYEEAISCYEEAEEIDPNRTSTWYNRGYALRHLGQYDEAISCFEKVLEINPDHYCARNSIDFIIKYKKYLESSNFLE
jgi:tetratricopeptide (TPR) repeat protein